MKKFKSSLGAKIVSWILLALFAFLFFVSIAGVGALIGSDAYFDGGRTLRNMVATEVFSFDRYRISLYASLVLGGAEDIEQYEYDEIYDPQNSNVFFTVEDKNGNVIIDHGSDEDYCEKFEYWDEYVTVITPKEITQSFETEKEARDFHDEYIEKYEIETSSLTEENGYFEVYIYYHEVESELYYVNAYIRDDFTATDKYYYSIGAVRMLVAMRFWIIFIGLISAVMCLLIMIFLCSAAGHKAGKDEIYLSPIHKIPFDLYAAFCIACVIWALNFFFEEVAFGEPLEMGIMLLLVFPVCAVLLASTVVTLAARIKNGAWWKNTVVFFALMLIKKFIFWIVRGIKYIVVNLPLYWKALFVFASMKVLELIFIVMGVEEFFAFWLFESMILAAAVIYVVISLRKLQKAATEISKGDLDYRVDVRYMTPSLKGHGENLNNIGNGLKTALGEQMKSEHMKAELITNVSHDIKTPLTSIVNYVGLLKRDGLDSPPAPEYLDVLDRQSVRLKKLTEDLIEASKATSGCITVNAENTDVNVLLSQAAAEYEGKFAENDLEMIMNLSENNPVIFADGRLVWRVFDNLFNNICKYAMHGTRVYLKSNVKDGKCTISFSNISKAPLNISGDELMERFVRGDASRNTEGSGLGLSIAKSLIDLQGGVCEIKIDGDFFKAEITFDIVK